MDEKSLNIIKDFWDNRSKKDNFLWAELSDLNYKLVSSYVNKNSTVLDLGAGDGALTIRVADIAKEVVAVDYAPIVKSINADNIKTIHQNVEEYQDNNSYDVILLFGVVNFLKDPITIYKFAKNHLNDGGVFLVKHQCGIDDDVYIESEIDGDKYIAQYRYWVKEIVELSSCGFDVEAIDPYPTKHNKWNNTFFKMFICK